MGGDLERDRLRRETMLGDREERPRRGGGEDEGLRFLDFLALLLGLES